MSARTVHVAMLAVLLCVPAAVPAQSPVRPRPTFWFNAGFGLGELEDPSSTVSGGAKAAFSASASVQTGIVMFSARAATVTEIFDDHVSDFGVLVGLASRPTGPFHAGAAVGIGRASGLQVNPPFFGGTATSTGGRVTVPAELQLAWRPLRFFGLALYGFASFNDGQTFGGATLNVQVGKLK
jgi:hypothetical protein